jgi:hypothetical protein
VQRSILKEKALGLVVGYQFKASDTLRANFVAGWQKNFDNGYTGYARDNGLDSGALGSALGQFAINRSVIQLHNGVIYNPLKNIDFGAEYIWGQRKTLAGEKGDTSRINLSGKYYFN